MSEPKDGLQTPVCDQLHATGQWNEAWDELYALDPQWTEDFLRMGVRPLSRGVLSPQVWELISIAVDASCTHLYAPGVRRHIQAALRLGVSKEEIMAVLEGVAVLGIHSCALGVPILVEELAALAPSRSQHVEQPA